MLVPLQAARVSLSSLARPISGARFSRLPRSLDSRLSLEEFDEPEDVDEPDELAPFDPLD